MKKINLYFGIAFLIAFLLSGLYMREFYKPEHLNEPLLRMQIRANHIYLLLIALLNLVSYKAVLTLKHRFAKYLHVVFRVALVISGIFAIIAFFLEHKGSLETRNFTGSSMDLALLAVASLLINEFLNYWSERKKD